MSRLYQPELEALIQAAPGGPEGASADTLRQAFGFAYDLLGETERFPGVSQIRHNLAVAQSGLELALDTDGLAAALLQGIPADKLVTAQVGELFGRNVNLILEGLAKLDVYTKTQSKTQRTLEAIRRALLTIIDGKLTIVLLRLNICLCDLNAAAHLPSEIQQALAQDALDIYAPLANRLGIWQLKWPIEDLAFHYLNPEKYSEIASALIHHRQVRDQHIQAAIHALSQKLHEEGIAATVTGRPKHIYSIYRKMERKHVGVEEVYDAQALRVILDKDDPENPELSEEARKKVRYNQTYRALGVVHHLWEPIQEDFDDYIQQPKQNGYRSLHTAVLDDQGNILEVQIRTRQMHKQAELGIAAHWAYKEGARLDPVLQRQIQSLRQLLPTLDKSVDSADENIEHLGEELLGERIFVFTPKDDIFDLPQGATPVDFAYAIHTDVGHRCRGAKVNGKMAPLNYRLHSGDRVEIITYPRDTPGRPNREWLKPNSGYTASNHTRSRIRRWFRQHDREQNIELGRKIVEEELKHYRLTAPLTLEELAYSLNETKIEDFLAKIGFGDVSRSRLEGALKLLSHDRRPPTPEPTALNAAPIVLAPGRGVLVMGAVDLPINFARCCNPIYPEPIIGYLTRGRGVTIHHQGCRQLQYKQRMEPGRVVSAEWGNIDKPSPPPVEESKNSKSAKKAKKAKAQPNNSYAVPYKVRAYRDTTLVRRIADSLKGQNVSLIKIKATNGDRYTDIYILAQVTDIDQAQWIRSKLQGFDNVLEVQSRQLTR